MRKRITTLLLTCSLLLGGISSTAIANAEEKKGESIITDKRAQSFLTSMSLSGYLGEMVNGNIANWALTALRDNPNIIEQISSATQGIKLGAFAADPFGQVSGGLISLDLASEKGHNGSTALAVTSLKKGTYGDMDYKIALLDDTRLDWRGADEVWFRVDASGYGSQGAKIGFAIQERNVIRGQLSNNYESWGIRSGVPMWIYNDESGNWQEIETVASTYTNWNGGRIPLPAGFSGWVALPLNSTCFSPYWKSASYNNTLDLMDVNQFQICVEGNEDSIGKTLYLSDFSIVGNGFGGQLPVSGRISDSTFTTVVPLEDILPGGQSYTGDLMSWYDEFPGKLLTGLAYNYLLSPSDSLKAAGDELTEALADVQGEDGYLGIYKGDDVFGGSGKNWDVWGHYHSIYGLLSWYRVSGNRSALQTAVKAADKVYDYFVTGKRTFNSAGQPTMNLAVSHAFAELYKETEDKRYLDAAEQIVEEDWPRSGNWMQSALQGKDFYQSSLPRWEALHTIMTLGTLWELTENDKYYRALETIWWSIAKTDRHNTGGFSSGETACGDPYALGAIETCCTVAWMALSTEYLQLSRNSVAADELELSYYNAMTGALLEGEKYVTYNTPMEGEKRASSQKDISFQYNSGSPDFNCCQANVSRGLGQLSQWAALTDDTTLYLNFYGETAMDIQTPGGQKVTLTQQTVYPENGMVTITLDGLSHEEQFTLALRIPSWASGSTVTADRKTSTAPSGEYFFLDRQWKNGDTVVLNIGMTFHTWVNEKTPEKASIYYGPILLSTGDSSLTDQSISFLLSDMEEATVSVANDGRHWLAVTFETETNDITLYDFSSIGKFEKYYTWLTPSDVPDVISAGQDKPLIWCNDPIFAVNMFSEVVLPPETESTDSEQVQDTVPETDPTVSDSKNKAGLIIGLVVAGVAAVATLTAVIAVFKNRKNKAK